MSQKFLECLLGRRHLLWIGKQKLVEQLRMLSRFPSDAGRIVHDDTSHDQRKGEKRRTQPIDPGNADRQSADGRGMGRGHSPCPEQPLDRQLTMTQRVKNDLEHLCRQPAGNGDPQDRIRKQCGKQTCFPPLIRDQLFRPRRDWVSKMSASFPGKCASASSARAVYFSASSLAPESPSIEA